MHTNQVTDVWCLVCGHDIYSLIISKEEEPSILGKATTTQRNVQGGFVAILAHTVLISVVGNGRVYVQ